MQRHLVNFRYGITTGEAVELAEAMGISITRQTVRNIIGSGFLQNLASDLGWYQVDEQEFLRVLDQWQTSEPIGSRLVQASESAEISDQRPYHLKGRRRIIPPGSKPPRLDRFY